MNEGGAGSCAALCFLARDAPMDHDKTDPRAVVAAINNAEWCDAVSRAHGAPCHFEDGFWINPGAAPPFYPNLVTLDPAGAALQQRAIATLRDDRKDGFGVKDSFCTLDLGASGMAPVFTANWLWLDAETPLATTEVMDIAVVEDPAMLAAWETAWRGGEPGADLFPAGLLADPRLAFLALRRGGRIVAGVALNRSENALGFSNLFREDDDLTALAALLTAARRHAPGLPLVGYEHGASLAACLAAGLENIGSLIVWVGTGR